MRAHHPGSETDEFTIFFNLDSPPISGQVNQNSIRNRLSRKAGACCTKNQRYFFLCKKKKDLVMVVYYTSGYGTYRPLVVARPVKEERGGYEVPFEFDSTADKGQYLFRSYTAGDLQKENREQAVFGYRELE